MKKIYTVRGFTASAEEWDLDREAKPAGSLLFNETNGQLKIADGKLAWQDLPYVGTDTGAPSDLNKRLDNIYKRLKALENNG